MYWTSKAIDDLLVCIESTILLNINKHSSSETLTPSADGVNVSEDECLFMFNKIVDSMQTNKSSMAFDVQYKRKTEIDFISGAVSKIGKKHVFYLFLKPHH